MKDFFIGFLFCLFIRIESWLMSVPAWLTLILHFTIGLSIWWFWATLGIWILGAVIRCLVLMFARWAARKDRETPPQPNKNPYSSTYYPKSDNEKHSG